MAADIPLRGQGQTGKAQLPDEVAGTPVVALEKYGAMHFVAKLSSQTLGQTRRPPQYPASRYRQAALAGGYELSSRNVAALAFTDAFRDFFGEDYLLQAGCSLNGKPSNYWPALMLRPRVDVQFATPKHILLRTFLKARVPCRSDATAAYRPPGPSLPDFQQLDRTLVEQLCELVIGAQIDDERLTVTELLRRSGMFERFRHHRQEFPLTQQFFSEFKQSESSERQVGGRSFWRARHPARYGTPQA
ncbi:hypothetical protein NHH73_02805 [Oxalobacteraceae bacterium OTU3CINTB1]|nr:hypothetical protein NHH73_02805 [Oxalobacteraceae bacterium OTU3CINTB1]